MQQESVDLAVRGRIVTMDRQRTVIEDGMVVSRAGRILALGPRQEIAARYRCERILGDEHAIVMPGFIDAHTHCTQCFVRSLTSGELPMIPRIYSPAQRSLDAEQAGATVRLLAAQLLRSGITTMCEGTLNPAHEPAIVAALEETGMRCVMARGAADQDFHHAALYSQIADRSWYKAREGEAERELAATEEFLRRHPPRGEGLIRGSVNVSALMNFSEAYFRGGAELARRHDTTMQVHIGRDREEVEFCLSVFGRRPVERLADLGVIDEHLVAVHAVLASEKEIELLARGHAGLAHSPVECVANLNAIPNLPRFRAAGIRVALGCDNQANDIFVNMRAAWLIHGAKWGIAGYDGEFLSAGDIIDMATIEAASVLRIDDIVGSLETGKAADIVILDGSGPHMMSMQHLSSELLRYASRAEVRSTIVAGKVLYSDGDFTTIDIDRLRQDAIAGRDHVREVVAARRYRPLPAW
ncbi:amidohydrolase family protein [Bosea sp. (in: a-proteobacteria)]|uniref:amidohydrolase family protein n=1 Tax=Bosea sp. (in: a-proteobacteria) TaxID=1871050 RepID=UPI002FC7076E